MWLLSPFTARDVRLKGLAVGPFLQPMPFCCVGLPQRGHASRKGAVAARWPNRRAGNRRNDACLRSHLMPPAYHPACSSCGVRGSSRLCLADERARRVWEAWRAWQELLKRGLEDQGTREVAEVEALQGPHGGAEAIKATPLSASATHPQRFSAIAVRLTEPLHRITPF
jgi:hypothetical protein